MILWAMRRRLLYLSVLFTFLIILIGIPVAYYLYEPPTCFDGKRNQDEGGVDCGGPCALLCPADSLPFLIHWTQKFKVTDSLWSVAAHIQNPNNNSGSMNVPYLFQLYDEAGVLLADRRGKVPIRPRASMTIFEGGFFIERVPARVVFSFTEEPVFLMPVTAVVFDKQGNAIAASRTIVDRLEAGAVSTVAFTWPAPFPVEIGYCDSPADVVVALDRSSSMDDIGIDPPQPLNDVKDAAKAFIDLFSIADQSSVVSFATTATNPPDQTLTSDRVQVHEAISRISIGQGVTQRTNIGDVLERAGEELFSNRHRDDSKRVVVLLTDGVANYPEREGDPAFGERYALSIASSLKEKGVLIYTIGLGFEVNEYFLRQIASGSGSYYSAATADTLASIYQAIATSICRKTNTSSVDINAQLFPGVNY